jgi:hypothetical protein
VDDLLAHMTLADKNRPDDPGGKGQHRGCPWARLQKRRSSFMALA